VRFAKEHGGGWYLRFARGDRGLPNSTWQAGPASSDLWFLPTNAVRQEESLPPTPNIIVPNRANKKPNLYPG